MKIKVIRLKNINKETEMNHPIEEGEVFIGEMPSALFKSPIIGESFTNGNLFTAPVTEIVSPTRFKTKNSEYYWKILSLKD